MMICCFSSVSLSSRCVVAVAHCHLLLRFLFFLSSESLGLTFKYATKSLDRAAELSQQEDGRNKTIGPDLSFCWASSPASYEKRRLPPPSSYHCYRLYTPSFFPSLSAKPRRPFSFE